MSASFLPEVAGPDARYVDGSGGDDWDAAALELLSDRDAHAPTLAEAETSGLLPSYDQVAAYLTSLRD